MSSLPAPLQDAIASAIGEIVRVEAVAGGCVSTTYRVEAGGGVHFLKADREMPAAFFAAEAAGLVALRESAAELRIPQPITYHDDPAGWSWIVIEWLEPSGRGADFWEQLGRGLARMHGRVGSHWGWSRSGFIGSLSQDNEPDDSWSDFWYGRRIEPQLRLARSTVGLRVDDRWRSLPAALEGLLEIAESEGPSPLHGDLWSGNLLATQDGPSLIDPSFYHGHREVDLAMMSLFGGFDPRCFDVYREEWPLAPGDDARRAAYQLYYLLVHVNLFGGSYLEGAQAALDRVLSAG